MATGTYRAGPFRPRTALVHLAAFFGYGLGLSALFAATGLGLPCPLRTLTGWSCPLCGSTHLGAALLRLDIAEAWAANPVVLILLVVLGVLAVLWTVEVLGGPAVRPPDQLADRLVGVHPTFWLALGLTAAVVYTLLRNLL